MYEDFKKYNKKENLITKFFFSFLTKTLIVILIFIVSMIYVKDSKDNKKNFKKIVYQNTISFAKIYDIYKNYIGDVIPFKKDNISSTKMVMEDKLIYKSIKKDGHGYLLDVSNYYSLGAITSGIVTEIKKDDKYGTILKIQDKNGLNISYGYVNNINVKLYSYVKKGQLLGICNSKLYLVFEKDNKYLSYEEYI